MMHDRVASAPVPDVVGMLIRCALRGRSGPLYQPTNYWSIGSGWSTSRVAALTMSIVLPPPMARKPST